MRTLHALVVLSVLLAGCSGPFGFGDEQAANQLSVDYPPGYGPDGVTNGTLAARTHESQLDDLDRYRLDLRGSFRSDDGTGNLSYTWTQGPTAARANYTTYNETTTETVGVWKRGETLRVSRGPGPYLRWPKSRFLTMQADVRVFPVTDFLDDRFTYALGALPRLNESTSDVTIVERDGERLFRVRSTTHPPTRGANVSYHEFEVTLWVDESGLVRRVERRAARTAFGERADQRTVARLTTTDVPAPSEPAWLDRTANVTAHADDGLLVVEHHGGPAVESAGYTPVAGDTDSSQTVPLNGSLAPGDTVYVYESHDGARLTASRTRPNETEYRPESGLLYFAAGNETVGVTVGANL